MLKCTHCEFTCTSLSGLRHHYASAHTLLYTKAIPEGSDDLASLKAVAKLLGGKLTCHNCSKRIGTAGYYKQHVAWCVSDKTAMGTCGICQKQFTKFWLHSHELNCRKKKDEEQLKKTLTAEQSRSRSPSPTIAVGKRKAATKAMSVIKNISQEVEDVDWTSMYRIPPMTEPSEECVKNWEDCFKRKEILTCTHTGCKVQYKFVKQMTEHYWTCPYNGLNSHTFSCKKCNKQFIMESGISSHVKTAHQKEDKKRKGKEDGDFQSDGQSASDDDITSGDPTDEEAEPEGDSHVKEKRVRNRASGTDSNKISFYSSYPIHTSYTNEDLCKSLHKRLQPRLPEALPNLQYLTNVLSETNLQEKISAKFTLESETSPRSLRVGEIASHKCELYNNMYPWHQD